MYFLKHRSVHRVRIERLLMAMFIMPVPLAVEVKLMRMVLVYSLLDMVV